MGPGEYIHAPRQELGHSASPPGRPPNGSGGGSPSAGPVHPATHRQPQPAQLFPAALPAGAAGRPGSQAACPTCATLPEAAKPRGDCGPHPGRPGHGRPRPQHRIELFTAGPAGGAPRGPRCANCWHSSFQLPHGPPSGGRRGSAAMGPLSSLPQNNSVFSFQPPNHFFFIIFLFFLKKQPKKKPKKKKNQTNLCGPSIVTPTIPKRGQGV